MFNETFTFFAQDVHFKRIKFPNFKKIFLLSSLDNNIFLG